MATRAVPPVERSRCSVNNTRHVGSEVIGGGLRLITAGAWLMMANACGAGLDVAPVTSEKATEWVEVGTPPPPAMPEEIKETQASNDLTWVDGCWEWSVGRWVWVRGGWVDPPRDATFFPGQLAIARDGRLMWAPCTWMVGEKAVGRLEPLVPALYPPTERTVQRD